MSISSLRPPGAGPVPQPPSSPSPNVPPPPSGPLPDLGKVIGDILRGGNPENGKPGTGLTGGISAGPIKDIFEDGSKLPGGLTGGIGTGSLGTFIGSTIGNTPKESAESADRLSDNQALGGPDTFNALELQFKLTNLKIRI